MDPDAELERRQQQSPLARLDRRRHKLLQAHHDDAVAPDLFEAEQRRITQEMETADTRLAAVDQLFTDIETTLDRALRLGEDSTRRTSPPTPAPAAP